MGPIDTETGEVVNRTLMDEGDEVRVGSTATMKANGLDAHLHGARKRGIKLPTQI